MSRSSLYSSQDIPDWMKGLDESQRSRLTRLLDEYLSKLEMGERMNWSQLEHENADLQGPLRLYRDQIDRLYGGKASASGAAAKGASAKDYLGPIDAMGMVDGSLQRLGEFLLVREIGRGGMGVVYEALQESLNRKVALKLLPLPAMFSANQVARFQNEAQAAAILQHPNIVPVYAVGVEKGIHYYAMPLIDGQSLDEVVAQQRYSAPPGISTQWLLSAYARHGKLNPILEIVAKAADALEAAHEVGIVHRDIKPSNLLLDAHGQIYVADFGLARMETEDPITRTGELIGTVRYMSPEQAAGKHALVDHRTDIYSLGATLYELLTLLPAIPGEDGPTLFQAIEKTEPISLRKVRRDIPRDLETVVSKAMSKRREDRYFSAREFAEDLRRVVAGRPTIAKPPALSSRFAKWATRHRGYFAAASVLLILGLSVIIRDQNRSLQEQVRGRSILFNQLMETESSLSQCEKVLEQIPGTEPMRAKLLKEMIAKYEAFLKENRDEPFVQQARAEVHNRCGNAIRRYQDPNEPHSPVDLALSHFLQSKKYFEELRTRNPKDASILRGWSKNQNDLGLAQSDLGRLDEGIESIALALEQLHKMETNASSDLPLVELATTYRNLGWLRWRKGDTEVARELFRKGIALLEEGRPPNAESVDDPMRDSRIVDLQADLKNNLASTYDLDDPAKAASFYRESLELRKKTLSGQLPQTLGMAMLHGNLAAALAACGEFSQSDENYQAAIDIQRSLAASSSLGELYQCKTDLAQSLNGLGMLRLKMEQFSEAIPHFEEAIAIQTELLENGSTDLATKSELGGAYSNLAFTFDKAGRANDASKAYVAAIRYQNEAHQAAPSEKKYRDFLSVHYRNFSRLLMRQKEWGEAAKLLVRRRDLHAKDPEILFSIAEEQAELAVHASHQNGEEREIRAIAEQAVETLQWLKKIGSKWDSSIIEEEPFSILVRFSSIDKLRSP